MDEIVMLEGRYEAAKRRTLDARTELERAQAQFNRAKVAEHALRDELLAALKRRQVEDAANGVPR